MIAEKLIQAILLAVILLVILHITHRWRQGEIHALQWLAWLVVWLSGGAAVTFPEMTQVAARMVGVGRGVDLMIYVAVITLFYISFRTLVRVERLNRDVTEVVRMMAIEARLREERQEGGPRQPPR